MIKSKEGIKEIEQLFMRNANKEKAPQMSAYLKNLFPFYGIQKPLRTALTKALVKSYSKLEFAEVRDLVVFLWVRPQREMHYFALDILYKVPFEKKSIELFEYLINNKSWWDTVDNIAIRLVGPYFRAFPDLRDKYIRKWTSGKNIWLIRTAILLQLKYKKETDVELLFELIRQHKASEVFFIQKAIGWALREYAYTDAKAVKKFIKENTLKPLSAREALKHIN